eukprot:TRINITY_DN1341_c1_g1_i1.p1 TRINITY_DN1341_c1_g1~~TRINITY_DN1341_c1_g1_i1.p1  ORF type:complete len:237 (-),score=81.89 TRINITY_DN1341_c1_g1_i1:108-818(-)
MVSPVWFYAPNVIGYIRVVLLFAAFYVCFDDYKKFFIFYALSEILDALDGYAARAFNQCTKFGAVLDQVTDRASTACLLVVLARLYPEWTGVFCLSSGIDLCSHFAHMYSSLSKGAKSHKEIESDKSYLLRIYYSSRAVLFFLCFTNEAYFLLIYLNYFNQGPEINNPFTMGESIGLVKLISFFVLPFCALKQFINFVQLLHACKDIVAFDEADRLKLTNNNNKQTTKQNSKPKKK